MLAMRNAFLCLSPSFKKGASDDVWARYLYVFGGSNSKKDQKHT